MASSRDIAALVGPALVAFTASETINFHIWATSLAPVVYLNGTLLLVAGLAIVRAHNRWRRNWSVLVTLVGWLGMVAGLYRMFAPEARQGGENLPTYGVIAVLFTMGSILTFHAYRRVTPEKGDA